MFCFFRETEVTSVTVMHRHVVRETFLAEAIATHLHTYRLSCHLYFSSMLNQRKYLFHIFHIFRLWNLFKLWGLTVAHDIFARRIYTFLPD